MTLTFKSLKSRTDWSDVLTRFSGADFHHSFEFHAISQENGEGEPMLLVAYDKDMAVMAWPLLERDIPGHDAKDLGSVYGYPGPLFAPSVNQHETLQAAFAHLETAAYVSVSARLHPVANAPLLVEDDVPNIRKLGMVVAADLSREQSELKREIRGAKNGTIKKIEKSGVTTRQSKDPADTAIFQKIYQETMDRIGATPYYYFTDAYMDALLAADSFDASYQFAELDGQVIAAASIIQTREIRQYYLSGTLSEHTRLSPMSLILRNQIFAAKEAGLKWFVLGGGLGGQIDSLTHFKLGFSKTTLPAGLICKILRPETYASLSASKGGDTDYFPAYRAP